MVDQKSLLTNQVYVIKWQKGLRNINDDPHSIPFAVLPGWRATSGTWCHLVTDEFKFNRCIHSKSGKM